MSDQQQRSDSSSVGESDSATDSKMVVGEVSKPIYLGTSPHVEMKENAQLRSAVWPHIESYDTFIDHNIKHVIKELDTVYVDPDWDRNKHELDPYYESQHLLKVYVSSISVGLPVRGDTDVKDPRMFPSYCRNAHISYGAPLHITFVHDLPGENKKRSRTVVCGNLPVMVRSNRCHLRGLPPKQLAARGEDVNDTGGYFIVNGNERCLRYVIQQRCNYPIALRKERFRQRDMFHTDCAVLLRSQRPDGTSTANILFHTEDGQCKYRVLITRREVFVPFWTLLRALMPNMPLELVKQKLFDTEMHDVVRLNEVHSMWEDLVANEASFSDVDIYEDRYLHSLGRILWDALSTRLRPGARYDDAGRYVIDRFILVHCSSWTAKFECLVLMYRKVLALYRGDISAENLDSFALQEVILPGQLMAAVLKDALYNVLFKIKVQYMMDIRSARMAGTECLSLTRDPNHLDSMLRRASIEVGYRLNYFLATGNIKTFQLDLQQTSGWTVVADRLNANRFLSHFRAVHRGQFFAAMKTTEVRKLLGETWGFLCPVHTPDGSPCGLLLHLARSAVPVAAPFTNAAVASVKTMMAARGKHVDLLGHHTAPPDYHSTSTFPLCVDGQVICRLPRTDFIYWTEWFRRKKMLHSDGIAKHLEIAAFSKESGAFEGLFLFSHPGRLVRPVIHLESDKIEWIGSLAQPWMHIAVTPEDVDISRRALGEQLEQVRHFTDRSLEEPPPKGLSYVDLMVKQQSQQNMKKEKDAKPLKTKGSNAHEGPVFTDNVPVPFTHMEVSPTNLLSITASMTPFSNHNQSPRNMYQCQMLKQTMGTPFLSIPFRTDNKAYRLLNPQKPLVTTEDYRSYGWDEYPSGTNAVVAVITYTGYDMEDAMILNKHSMERGAFHGCVYKTKIIDAAPTAVKISDQRNYFFNNRTVNGDVIDSQLDGDGLPPVGKLLRQGDKFYRCAAAIRL
eukprot:GHVN01069376.1.p1 GENE.GHVN01069376.1~~GHVN01069376.1.p1  ORF type:complete len:959 (+),score=108.46 GHVN01069376.1:75-2951(+)